MEGIICFYFKLSATATLVANRYPGRSTNVSNGPGEVNGFDHKAMAVVTKTTIEPMSWGLVPHWVRGHDQAAKIRNKTLNARSETIFEKASFREAINERRCIIPANAYFEWHHHSNGTKEKFEISMKDREIFSLAGVWDEWIGPETGVLFRSFSLITCDANPLLVKVHNSKKRMPIILPREKEEFWLQPELSLCDTKSLMLPFDEKRMLALPAKPVESA